MSAKLIGMMIGTILSFPAYLAAREIKQYQDHNFTREIEEKGTITASLINDEDGIKVMGTITKEAGSYLVTVITTMNGSSQTVSHTAPDKDAIAQYLEKNTRLRIGDFSF